MDNYAKKLIRFFKHLLFELACFTAFAITAVVLYWIGSQLPDNLLPVFAFLALVSLVTGSLLFLKAIVKSAAAVSNWPASVFWIVIIVIGFYWFVARPFWNSFAVVKRE
jgi:phage-related minor tail protein